MKYKFYRGGCWNYIDPSWVRAAYRNWSAVSNRINNLGFRCARVEMGP